MGRYCMRLMKLFENKVNKFNVINLSTTQMKKNRYPKVAVKKAQQCQKVGKRPKDRGMAIFEAGSSSLSG